MRQRLELRQREVDVRALAAERRVDETDDLERGAVQVEGEPTVNECFAA